MAGASYRYDLSRNDGETGLVGNQFNMIVGENEMKFDAAEPSQNSFSYGGSDAIMWVADRFDQVVRGHTLAWLSQVPGWVSLDGKKNNHNFTRQQLLNILKNHIFNVVKKYKGRIREWDVCYEVLDDDQSIVRTDPTAYKLRPSMVIWGISDNHSWRDNQPLLYDNGLQAKPAYYNIHAQLRLTAERNAAKIEDVNQAPPQPR